MSADAIYNVILGAHISEKATVVAEQSNQFVFKVRKDSNPAPRLRRPLRRFTV